MQNFYKNFSYAIFFSWSGLAFTSILKILRAPIIIYSIGIEDYGIWITIVLVAGIALNYENAVISTIAKNVSSHSNDNINSRFLFIKKNNKDFNKLIFQLSLLLGGLFFLVIQTLHIISQPQIEYKFLLFQDICAAISIIIYFIGLKYVAYLDGIDRVQYARVGKIFFEVIGFILVLSILYFKTINTLGFILLAQSASFYIFNILLYKYVKKQLFHLNKNSRVKDESDGKNLETSYEDLFENSLNIIWLQSSTIIYSITPLILIPIFFDYKISAQYALLIQVCQVANFIILPLLISFLPKLVHEVSSNRIKLFLNILSSAFLLIVLYFICLQLFIDNIFLIWVNQEYLLGDLFLASLCIICIIECYNQALRQICIAVNLEHKFLNISLNSTFIFFISLILFVYLLIQYEFMIFLIVPTLISITYVIYKLYRLIKSLKKVDLYFFKPKFIINCIILYLTTITIAIYNWTLGLSMLIICTQLFILYLLTNSYRYLKKND